MAPGSSLSLLCEDVIFIRDTCAVMQVGFQHGSIKKLALWLYMFFLESLWLYMLGGIGKVFVAYSKAV